MKVFASLFSKSDRPSKGAQPLVAPAGAKFLQRRFFGSFFAATCSKKERKRFPHITSQQIRAMTWGATIWVSIPQTNAGGRIISSPTFMPKQIRNHAKNRGARLGSFLLFTQIMHAFDQHISLCSLQSHDDSPCNALCSFSLFLRADKLPKSTPSDGIAVTINDATSTDQTDCSVISRAPGEIKRASA